MGGYVYRPASPPAIDFALRYPPPPPLRSGNDLARCLNWGGSIAQLQQQPLPGLLEEVAVAVPTLLDRWDVRITPEVGTGVGEGRARCRGRNEQGAPNAATLCPGPACTRALPARDSPIRHTRGRQLESWWTCTCTLSHPRRHPREKEA